MSKCDVALFNVCWSNRISVNEYVDTEEFSLDDCALPTAKQSEYGIRISDTLRSEQGSDIVTLIEQCLDVLSSLPGRADEVEHDIKLLTYEPIMSKGYPIPFKTHDVMVPEI